MQVYGRHVRHARHGVLVEVALLHLAVLEGDRRAGQRGAERHGDGTLRLCFDGHRIDGAVAMDRAGDVMQHRLALLHRSFDHVSHHGIERFVHRHAESMALGQFLLAVARLFHRQIEYRQMARMLLADQALAVGNRILARHVGRLVDQRFHHEGGVGRAD